MKNEMLIIQVGDLTFSTFQEKTPSKPAIGERIGQWRWHCKAANYEIVCTSGESFDSKGNAERAVRNFVDRMASAISRT